MELARALGATPGVYRVDLLTRQISAPDVDWSYGEPTEMLTQGDDAMNETGESAGAYIIRIPFGPRDKYIPKERLWPHIQEFVDGALNHIMQVRIFLLLFGISLLVGLGKCVSNAYLKTSWAP